MIPNPDLAAWTRTDRLIKAWITTTISEEALGTVVGLTTSLDVWKALSNAYSQDSQAREFELLLKLQEKKKDTKKVFWLLNGLGPRYESFSTAMLKPPVPSYLDLIPLLHSHELRNKSLLIDQPNPALAFVGQRFNSNKGSSFNSRGKGFHQSGSRPPYTPWNGHHHSSSKNNSQSGTPHSSQTDSIPHCQICKKRGHHALKCWHRFDNSYQDDHVPQALAALHLNTPIEGEWVPDIGATAYLTDDPSILSKLQSYVDSDSVMVGNGSELPINHTSHANIFSPGSSLTLNNVLVVPDIKKNLLSVSQLTSDYPCYFQFDDHGFVIKDLRTHKVLALGSKEAGFMFCDMLLSKFSSPVVFEWWIQLSGMDGTPEQNSVAERKHRHVVELGLAIDKHKGYRCLHLSTGRVYTSRHVVFDEYSFPFAPPISVPPVTELVSNTLAEWISPSPAPPPKNPPIISPTLDKNHARLFTSENSPSLQPIPSLAPENSALVSSPPHISSPPSLLPKPPTSTHSMTTRSRNGIVKPNPKYALTVVFPTTPPEPKSVRVALRDPGWRAAMDDEMKALHQNNTWVLVPRQPSMHIIGCRWIFKTKLHSDGSLDRLKARLVAKGYNQQEGVDFLETFSPVIHPATIRIILTLATVKGWSFHQLDVKNAFLHGHLDTTVFMDQPLGFEDYTAPTHVCQLKHALYGLKQAPRAWFDRFSSFLIDYGFFCSTADSSLFIYNHDSHILILLVYVDDIILIGSLDSLLAEFVSLGYLLAHTKMLDCKPVATPMASKRVSLSHAEELYSDITEYRRIVGTLQYLTLTRLDLSYAVNTVCQYMHAPTNEHFQMVKRILRYVKGTLSLGVRILRHSSLDLFAFSDADWAGCLVTRRSTTGFCTFLGSNCISWSAKKQPTVSRSSTEAEYHAMASTVAELTWVSFILRVIGLYQAQPLTLFCDNLSALHMSLADLFTKPLSRVTFDGLKSKLGLWATPTSSLKGGKEEYPTCL
uniref:Uncharacterized protein n=1 Tax=Fagus sylvatica TaxID=28930 RepID=A0A2N9H082_FAGSY